MKSRRLASLAIVASVLVGTTGCAMFAPQATTLVYSPAEGVGAASGDVAVRNAIIVSEDGVDGNLIAALVNESSEAQTLRIEVGAGAAKSAVTARIPARSSVSLGAEPVDGDGRETVILGEEPILFEGIDTLPGAMIPVYFQSGDAEGELVQVPVLDGAIDYLAPFVP